MEYSVTCSCGHRVAVSASQAGMTVTCACGGSISIPRLSTLRKQSGETAYDASPELIIRYSYSQPHQAVGGEACAICGASTVDRIRIFVECEKPIRKGEHPWFVWIFMALFSVPMTLLYSMVRREPELVSEAKVLEAAVSLCKSCQPGALTAHSLREILLREPEFARLFDKYPSARVWADRSRNA